MNRKILDISTLARWSGPPVGILRAQQMLALHVVRQRPDIVLAVYDSRKGRLRKVNTRWREALAGFDTVIDVNTLDFRWRRKSWQNLFSIRYPLAMALQRLQLSGPAFLRDTASALQKPLLGSQAGAPPFTRPDGRPHTILPVNTALGDELQLGPGDSVLRAGMDWQYEGIEMLQWQRQAGFRLAVLCYDLLPLTHPEFFPEREHKQFEAYWRAVLPAARILCNSRCIAGDIRTFAARQDMAMEDIKVVPLGYTAPHARDLPPLPAPLRQQRFALFVSTIEPRKGHAMLLRAWRQLLQVGIPQRHDFHLVLAGRPGWMVGDVLEQLRAIGETALHLPHLDDAALERLYQDAAFCLYPSQYEGFGLPIIEAFAHGKATIASTGGAVPETVAGLSPCLPGDAAAWASTLAEWIENPEAHKFWERKIAAQFRYDSWPQAAEKILQAGFA